MDQALKNRVLRLHRRSHPTYPTPLQIRIVEGRSPSGNKHPVVVVEDLPGLQAAYRIRPCGRLEEVAPFPMKAEIPGQPGRYRLSLLGLPGLLCDQRLESYLRVPDRILTLARWKQAQADQVEEVIDYFTQQLEHLIPQAAELKVVLKQLADDFLKDKARRAVAAKLQEIARQVTAARTSREVLLDYLEGLRKQVQDLNRRAPATG